MLRQSSPPLFELLDVRPAYLPAFDPNPQGSEPNPVEYSMFEPRYDTDEEFEVLDQ